MEVNNQNKLPLFAETGTDAAPQSLSLIGGKCVCGYVFFPMQSYGCEKCGRYGDDLQQIKLSGRGTLNAFAQVYLHARPLPKTPFTVVTIALEDGPHVRALLEPATDPALRSGDAMIATLVNEDRGEGSVNIVRFKRAGTVR